MGITAGETMRCRLVPLVSGAHAQRRGLARCRCRYTKPKPRYKRRCILGIVS
ncbi:Protein of unknown function [Pyronema omphalodes CBS 100304]|uniref:Uncharacterized protein n=1 Tax=Pyronema omphalodes (strain CBS 100304) TaxID=1076935 RepID=U4L5L6_PYROM|nr:Protein of unknown function [Pyronema omphalodes CBS 100304]